MRIETVAMRVPLDRVYKGSHYRMTHRSTIITRVHTASGIIGEAYAGDEDAGLEEIDGIIRNEIEPVLIGQDAFSTELCWTLAHPATWNILRDRRLGLVVTACVDVAIWDAVGKVLSMPLHKLWGGYRTSVPVITIGGYYAEDANISVEVNGLVEAGFAGMKFKIGGLTPDEDAVRFRKARETAGPDFKLAVDANQGWTPAQAIKFAQLVDDCDIMWFEEPCVWQNDRRAMRDVRLAGGVPVCAGVRRPERVLSRRMPRPHGDRFGRLPRLPQLRLILVGRPHRVAPCRRHRDRLRRADGAPRGTASCGSSPGVNPARHLY